jgi:hypothetical protein
VARETTIGPVCRHMLWIISISISIPDGRANGGWRVRSLAEFLHMYRSTITKTTGKMAGKTFQRCGESASFLCVAVSVPPIYPRDYEGPRLGGKSRREERLRLWVLGAGLTRCDGGVDERPREEVFIFASLSPPFCGKTEVTHELD